MNNNPYDQNQQNTNSDNQQSFNNNTYAQDNSQSSNNYGNSYANHEPIILNEKPKMNGLALASMILGIASLGCCCSSYICGILAIIFGIVARSCGNKSGKSMTGIICGAISLGLMTLLFIFYFVMGILTASEATEMALFISRMIV